MLDTEHVEETVHRYICKSVCSNRDVWVPSSPGALNNKRYIEGGVCVVTLEG